MSIKSLQQQWISQKSIPLFNFTQPFIYSSSEFIVANSSKFKHTPFWIWKFNSKTNEWNRMKILPSTDEDPAEFVIALQNTLINIQSISADPRIMDHYGINNVAFDSQNKIFYAIGIDWSLWNIPLATSNCQQAIIRPSDESPSASSLHGRDDNKSYLYQPYLFIDDDIAYVLTAEGGHRYSFSFVSQKITGFNFHLHLFRIVSWVNIYKQIFICLK